MASPAAPHLWITRPLEDGAALAEQLQHLGIVCHVAPVSRVKILAESASSLRSALVHPPRGIIVTSKQGVRALATLSTERHIPLLAVGKVTAQEARNHGFTKVETGGGYAHGIVEYMLRHKAQERGPWLYASGQHVSLDLPEMLAPHGFQIRRIPLYIAQATPQMDAETQHLLAQNALDGVVFYSKRAAEIATAMLTEWEEKQGKKPFFADAFCLSARIAASLPAAYFGAVHHATAPAGEALIAQIRRVYANA